MVLLSQGFDPDVWLSESTGGVRERRFRGSEGDTGWEG